MILRVRMSVAIVNYNHGRFVGAAVTSALTQTVAPDEVVVVDDGSTDDSRRVLAGFGNSIRVLHQPNRGVAEATNTALRAVTGDVVLLLDADDICRPERVERVLDIYRNHPEVDWVWHDLRHVDAAASNYLDTTPKQVGYSLGRHDHRRAVSRGRLPITAPATSALSWRTEFVQKLLPIPPGLRIQDIYLKFASLGLGRGYVTTETLSLQRIHEANAYTNVDEKQLRALKADNCLLMAPSLRTLGLTALGNRFEATGRALKLASGPDRHLALKGLSDAAVALRVIVEVARDARTRANRATS